MIRFDQRYINDIEHRAFGTVDLGDMKLVEVRKQIRSL